MGQEGQHHLNEQYPQVMQEKIWGLQFKLIYQFSDFQVRGLLAEAHYQYNRKSMGLRRHT